MEGVKVSMSNRMKYWLKISGISAMIVLLAACGNQQSADKAPREQNKPSVQQASLKVAEETVKSKMTVYGKDKNNVWLPLKDAVQALGLRMQKVNDEYLIGDTDPAYSVRAKGGQASSGGETIELGDQVRLNNGEPYITNEALAKLLKTKVSWNEQSSTITITPRDDQKLATRDITNGSGGTFRSLAAGGASASKILQYAKQHLNTPYDFGSGSYEENGTFDCSSFTQHVYGEHGVELPRTSLAQSKVGQTISEEEMQAGDLMFFYTPGRYESNKVVGHVGIYMGNNQMIHTYGDPGVVINGFTEYWKGRFLFAKRVL